MSSKSSKSKVPSKVPPPVHSFFTKKEPVGPTAEAASTVSAPSKQYSLPTSDNPDICAFYAQLSENERVAHSIAVEKLGTSYDVTRTHGFLKWVKKRASAPNMS